MFAVGGKARNNLIAFGGHRFAAKPAACFRWFQLLELSVAQLLEPQRLSPTARTHLTQQTPR
jgi:hypothetical protein